MNSEYAATRTLSPSLPRLIKMIVDGGPTREEYLLMGVIAMMDEKLEYLMASEYNRQEITKLFCDIENYLIEGEDH